MAIIYTQFEGVKLMPNEKNRIELINVILGDQEERKLEEEEIIHVLLEHKVAKNTSKVNSNELSLGSRMADNIAKFAGSWTFITIFIACLIAWITINVLMLSRAFDVYPFILLNLILSCIAAIQAPVIMMSQNRQEEKDRLRSQNDYKVNLKAEIILEDLHVKIDQLIENQERILDRLQKVEKHNENIESRANRQS